MPDETIAAPSGEPATPPAAPAAPVVAPPALVAPTTQTPAGDVSRPVVPEKYDFKAPEGYSFNDAGLAKFQEMARGLGMSQEQAQAHMDYFVGELTGTETRRTEAYQKQQEAWVTSIKADKELGGKAFDQTVSRCQKAMSVIDPSGELRKVVDAMGIGNHPVMVRAWARLGSLMEDDAVDTGSGSSAPRDAATILYGKN